MSGVRVPTKIANEDGSATAEFIILLDELFNGSSALSIGTVVSGAAEAQAAADAAQAAADAAQSTADGAETNAQTGISDAADAQATGDTANTAAGTAQTAADAAQASADIAALSVYAAAQITDLTNTLDGWARRGAAGNTLTSGATYATLATTGNINYMHNTISLGPGANVPLIRARIRRTDDDPDTGWLGRCYYKTAGHSYSTSYYKDIPAPQAAEDEWFIVEWDMSVLNAGGSDYITNDITGIRIDFTNLFSESWDIDWVSFGAAKPSTVDVLQGVSVSPVTDSYVGSASSGTLGDFVITANGGDGTYTYATTQLTGSTSVFSITDGTTDSVQINWAATPDGTTYEATFVTEITETSSGRKFQVTYSVLLVTIAPP